ncbi:MAG: hypothetical protein M0T74_14165 [Desulfitobacterium hafniense]|nr:hypothetical protein [Desulfitobacterium hafniense]
MKIPIERKVKIANVQQIIDGKISAQQQQKSEAFIMQLVKTI